MLDGRGRGVLKNFVPTVIDHSKGSKRCRSSRHAACGLQLESRYKVGSLDAYKSYLGCIHHVWSKLPQDVLRIGEKNGWSKITKRCKLHLMGKQPKCRAAGKRVKITKQKVRVTNGIDDGFDIGGFKTNRVCEFEVEIKNYDMSLKKKS